MQGQANNSNGLFCYFQPEDMIPENHLLKQLKKYIDFSFIRQKVNHLYSHTGRPSVVPEVMIKMLLIGYLFNITSERKLCDEISMHIGYRWFCGLSMGEKVPNHSTFSKNRHGRFKQSGIFQDIFDEIIRQCIELGIVSGEHVTADGTFVKANASLKNMEPIPVQFDSIEYIKEVEKKNPVKSKKAWEPDDDYKNKGKKISNKTHVSKTDPDSTIGRKGKSTTNLYYCANFLMDNKNQIVVGVKTSKPNRSGEMDSAELMLKDLFWKFGIKPISIGVDKGYAVGKFIYNVIMQGIKPHTPINKYIKKSQKEIYPIDDFKFDLEKNKYICPQGKYLKYHGFKKNSLQLIWRAQKKECKICPCKKECTKDVARSISRHIYSEYIEKAKKDNNTKEYIKSQIKRKWIEGLFGEAKQFMGLRDAKFREGWNVKEQFLMTALALNIKRMAKILAKRDDGGADSNIFPFLSIIGSFFYNIYRNISFYFRYVMTRQLLINLQGT